MNRLWDTSAPAGDEFDPDNDYAYADRTRRRAPGDNTLGLSPHMDAGSFERWLDPVFRQIYAHLLAGHPADDDPWRAALGVDAHWHPELLGALVPIPLVEPGDTVWWHPDVVHAVGNEHRGSEYASVIYVGASPACRKNQAYALRQREAFLAGRSAPDFAAEDHEVSFTGRATFDGLTELGRRQMALDE